MTRNQTASVSGFGAHTRTFVLSAAIGAVVALGVRSMFEDAAGNSHEAHAAPSAPEHHAAAGHEGHAHGDEQSAPDEHEGHQKHRGETKKDGEEPPKKKADAGDSAPAPKPQGVLLALGNANCPVMGDEVDGETFSEWRGLRVGHCCPRCGKRFLENPESLLDEVSPGWRDALAAAQAIDAASGKERDALLTAAAKKWKVLRRPAALVKKKQAGLLVDVGNANCPVMGGEVDGETFSEWKGLRVGHCCPGCGKRFLENPEKLLDEVAPKWRKARAAVEAVRATRGDERAKALARLRKHWTVVREPAPEKSHDSENKGD